METTFDYLRQFGPLLAERILETYPPLQSAKDPVAPGLAALLREPLPAQALAITGTAKYLRKAKAARIVAGPAFQPSESLKALVYFEGGDLNSLNETTRRLHDSCGDRRRRPAQHPSCR